VEKIADAEGFTSVDGVVLGVDSHLDAHVAVALDGLGRRLGDLTAPTTTRGYERLRETPSLGGRVRFRRVRRNRGNQQLRGRAHALPQGCRGLGGGAREAQAPSSASHRQE
jgi:hypothetical protein